MAPYGGTVSATTNEGHLTDRGQVSVARGLYSTWPRQKISKNCPKTDDDIALLATSSPKIQTKLLATPLLLQQAGSWRWRHSPPQAHGIPSTHHCTRGRRTDRSRNCLNRCSGATCTS